jgi:hypothetical protein
LRFNLMSEQATHAPFASQHPWPGSQQTSNPVAPQQFCRQHTPPHSVPGLPPTQQALPARTKPPVVTPQHTNCPVAPTQSPLSQHFASDGQLHLPKHICWPGGHFPPHFPLWQSLVLQH